MSRSISDWLRVEPNSRTTRQSPDSEQDREVRPTDDAITIEVRRTVGLSPFGKQDSQVRTTHRTITIQIGG
ncbi:MAG TPA: hypothetical protein DCX60_02485, partial [Phycisphaerales bacterium]|nr:hypothetical protein [Phycisphaerales bacterium]